MFLEQDASKVSDIDMVYLVMVMYFGIEVLVALILGGT
jgi:hypothetical protein